MISIGQRLQSVRVAKSITQAKLAERTGIPQSGLSNIERGKNDITVSTMIRICSALDVNPAELFQGRIPGHKMVFTRDRIERIAAAAAGKTLKLSTDEKSISENLKMIIPLNRSRKSVKKIQRSWDTLQKQYSEPEIKILTDRVLEAKERLRA